MDVKKVTSVLFCNDNRNLLMVTQLNEVKHFQVNGPLKESVVFNEIKPDQQTCTVNVHKFCSITGRRFCIFNEQTRFSPITYII